MYTQQPWIVEVSPSWHKLSCLQSEERLRLGFPAPRGYLSGNRGVEAFLQCLFLFGPSMFLLTAAPLKIYQLYRSKLVTVPNHRGLVKAVSQNVNIGLRVFKR